MILSESGEEPCAGARAPGWAAPPSPPAPAGTAPASEIGEDVMKVRAVVQARMLSSRLRGKSLLSVAGQPLLGRVLHRIQAMSFVHETVVATTLDAADEPIVALVTSRGIRCVRGERSDLLARFLQAACDLDDNDVLVRFTADNPLYDPTRSAAAWRAHSW